MKNKILYVVGFLLICASIILSGYFASKNNTALGSVSIGGEYQGTTTSIGRFPAVAVLKTEQGTLGSVIITGANTGTINIYDATTTSILQRNQSQGTSTILLATFPASATAGTYTFDRVFFNGLLIETIGLMPTTTITSR